MRLECRALLPRCPLRDTPFAATTVVMQVDGTDRIEVDRIPETRSQHSLFAAPFSLYGDCVACRIQNHVKTLKKHLHTYEKRTTISGA
jgi:hypothetical protein